MIQTQPRQNILPEGFYPMEGVVQTMGSEEGYLHRCDACGWEGYTKWEWKKLDVKCKSCGASVHGNQLDGVGGQYDQFIKKYWWVVIPVGIFIRLLM